MYFYFQTNSGCCFSWFWKYISIKTKKNIYWSTMVTDDFCILINKLNLIVYFAALGWSLSWRLPCGRRLLFWQTKVTSVLPAVSDWIIRQFAVSVFRKLDLDPKKLKGPFNHSMMLKNVPALSAPFLHNNNDFFILAILCDSRQVTQAAWNSHGSMSNKDRASIRKGHWDTWIRLSLFHWSISNFPSWLKMILWQWKRANEQWNGFHPPPEL